MLETLQTCGGCKQDLPEDAFYATATSNWCKSCYRAWYVKRSGGMAERNCDACGSSMLVTARRAKEPRAFCSRKCKSDARLLEGRAIRAVTMFIRAAARPPCPQCGKQMPAMRSDAVYCSAECSSRAHGLKRGNERIGPGRRRDVERAYIVERDGGRCHLCGAKPKGAELTIDHILPLALGGTHSPENLAVACRSCNCAKGSRAANDQLRMVG